MNVFLNSLSCERTRNAKLQFYNCTMCGRYSSSVTRDDYSKVHPASVNRPGVICPSGRSTRRVRVSAPIGIFVYCFDVIRDFSLPRRYNRVILDTITHELVKTLKICEEKVKEKNPK